MSSDNYYLIRKLGDEYLVTMEFASDEDVTPLAQASGKVFKTFSEAGHYANNEYSEYGTIISDEVWEEEESSRGVGGQFGIDGGEDSQREGSESEESPSRLGKEER